MSVPCPDCGRATDRALAADRRCSTCGGDPQSHPSGLPCVCGDGTREGEVRGLRLAAIEAERALAAERAAHARWYDRAEALRVDVASVARWAEHINQLVMAGEALRDVLEDALGALSTSKLEQDRGMAALQAWLQCVEAACRAQSKGEGE